MKPGIMLGLPAIILMLGSGCFSTEPISSARSGASNNCNTLDYGIQEFNLFSSRPIISNTYELKLAVERVGDCTVDELSIAVYEDGRLLSRYNLAQLDVITPVNIDWSPKTDQEVSLSVELELLDDNNSNNSERITVSGFPLGNYMSVADLSGDTVNASGTLAEKFTISHPINITSVELYLTQATQSATNTQIIAQILADEGGLPGEALASAAVNADLQPVYNWIKIPIDLQAEQGSYWLSLDRGTSVKWHYSRKRVDGSEQIMPEPRYKTNSLTAYFNGEKWQILPEKDYTYKVHAGDK